jgi:ATP-dependent helicase/nuclease subunit A
VCSKGSFSFIDELNDEQKKAAVVSVNAAVSAGAGSGKTRVLTSRYGWLIMTGRCKVEEILTITFTNKAANEMYSRIYGLLAQHAPENEYAREAIKYFHKAHISTLDSFCAALARTVCRRFGISPDFQSDDLRVRELARSLALRFVLDKRDNPALQQLIAEKKMRVTADELFVEPLLYHSPVSRPLDFKRFEQIQREEIINRWKEYSSSAELCIDEIRKGYSALPLGNTLQEHLAPLLSPSVEAPDIEALFDAKDAQLRERAAAYFSFLADLKNSNLKKGGRELEAAVRIRKAITELKHEIYEKLKALANHALQWDIVKAVFPLIEEFQDKLNRKKRETGILTFTDIAHLAVDGLSLYPDIRQVYKNSFKMIMIDEFQDNNSLQRDLVSLLAEKKHRSEQGIPAHDELEENKVFYVGDEKQSIYRFRGADVSVFHSLADQIGCKLNLSRNYRSNPALIRAFNRIFGGYGREDDPSPGTGVFPHEGTAGLADYEAVYHWTKNRDDALPKDGEAHLHFAFFDAGRLEDTDDRLRAEDHEAVYIAQKIRALVNKKRIYDKDKKEERPCRYSDIAVLQRSYTHQHTLERAFNLFGIPFSADRPAGLFKDAPVNDLWAFLKLLVYPDNRLAYGSLLRSPFVRLSEDAFTLCMLKGKGIFDPDLDAQLPPLDRERYKEARQRYRDLLAELGDLSLSSLVTKLWYDYGYRYETLWSLASQVYLDMYDLFFELAKTIEDRGKGLIDFLDYLNDLSDKKEKFDDVSLPDEEGIGVKLLSIHRCKGLEFPVVFVYGCGHREDTKLDQGLTLFSERWGVSLRLPHAEELPLAGDYFYLVEKEDHKKKTGAELRRLLYVAMTRAESKLYVTAVIPKQSKDDRKVLNPETAGGYEEFIVERLEQYRTNPKIRSISFLRLFPVLSREESSPYTIEPIYNYSSELLQRLAAAAETGTTEELSMEAAATEALPVYRTIAPVSPYHSVQWNIAASSLHTAWQPSASAAVLAEKRSTLQTPPYKQSAAAQGEFNFADSGDLDSKGLDDLLKQTGLEEREFGAIVHSFIEARFNNQRQRIPPRFAAAITSDKQLTDLDRAAKSMAGNFFDSDLGRLALSASYRETEFSVLTAATGSAGMVTIMGKIDLLFEVRNTFHVVDFKTDRVIDSRRHEGQLAVYERAVADIFKKPVRCWLFYLRTGESFDLSGKIAAAPEELVAIWEKELHPM